MLDDGSLPPWHMRLWLRLPVPVFRDMILCADHGRAKAGERWSCLCGSLFGRAYMIPWSRRPAERVEPPPPAMPGGEGRVFPRRRAGEGVR